MSRGICTCVNMPTVFVRCYVCNGTGQWNGESCYLCTGKGEIETKALNPLCPMHGMSCDDYTLIVAAGDDSKNLPSAVRERMNNHLAGCKYHQSKRFTLSAMSIPVTAEMGVAAATLVLKLAGE